MEDLGWIAMQHDFESVFQHEQTFLRLVTEEVLQISAEEVHEEVMDLVEGLVLEDAQPLQQISLLAVVLGEHPCHVLMGHSEDYQI